MDQVNQVELTDEDITEMVNAYYATMNLIEEAFIRSAQNAVKGMKKIKQTGRVPASVIDSFNAHLRIARDHKNESIERLAARVITCNNVTSDAVASGNPVSMNGGSGK